MPNEQPMSTYTLWFGRSVALRVVAGEMRSTVCVVMGESDAALRVVLEAFGTWILTRNGLIS